MTPRQTIPDELRALIAQERLVPGNRLPPERELAARLGVSRSALREGMRRLTDLGIIEPRRGSGTYVAAVELADLLGVRLQLEPYAARLAAERRDPEDLAQLDAALARMSAARGDASTFAQADIDAHGAIAAASRNAPLRMVLDALADVLRHSRATTSPDVALHRGALSDLRAVASAIRDGDPPAAEAAMRSHLQQVGDALRPTDSIPLAPRPDG